MSKAFETIRIGIERPPLRGIGRGQVARWRLLGILRVCSELLACWSAAPRWRVVNRPPGDPTLRLASKGEFWMPRPGGRSPEQKSAAPARRSAEASL